MILVVGATGVLGGMITRQLLEHGETVRILVRPESPSAALAEQGMATAAQTLIDAGAHVVHGDLKEPATLAAACAGVDTVITTANSVLRGGADTLATVDVDGTKHLIDAAKAAQVKHCIYTSALGADLNHPHPLFQAKGQSEEYLRTSGLTYTILRPGLFMEIWIGMIVGAPLRANQPVTLVGQGAHTQAFVSMADVAAYAVAAVDNPAAKNAEIEIGGPAAYTWTQAVEAVGRAIHREVPITYVAPGSPIPLVPEMMSHTLTGLEMADSAIDMTETTPAYGITPTPLDQFAQRFFGTPR